MASKDYQRFLETFLATGPAAAQEGPDTAALARLQDEERVEAEKLLLSRLGHADSRAAVGLGVLQSAEAGPDIRRLMEECIGSEKEVDAEALIDNSLACYRIEGDARVLENIQHVLEVSPIESIRIAAANALAQSGAKEAHAPLWKAIENDESGLVRCNAAKALMIMHGKLDDPRESPPVTIRLMVKAPHVRAEAVQELKKILAS
ncbi:MAG TPA: HEAT repeat domain-containing protein [Polyangium sp.]|nr:HEAT repeat domain-containing protein [Polyangium sp.]